VPHRISRRVVTGIDAMMEGLIPREMEEATEPVRHEDPGGLLDAERSAAMITNQAHHGGWAHEMRAAVHSGKLPCFIASACIANDR
jgi:hypothetical protein